jgi:mitochondrial fission protein ELM1
MITLRILHITDGRPGHYHLAEGVIAALGRIKKLETNTLLIKRRLIVPGRYLRMLVTSSWCSPDQLLSMGYGIDAETLSPADLIVSSGGETLPVNLAAKRLLNAENIFVGSRRGVDVDEFSLIISSYERHQGTSRHLVTLKPSALDPDALGRPVHVPTFSADNPPSLIGLLVGGDSGLFKYRDEEWLRLFDFAREVSRSWGARWLISTSPRTPQQIAQAAFDLAKDKDVVADFIDYKLAGPGTLSKIFSRADVIMCSEDSSSMISEAVWARLPVMGVSPAHHAFKPEEREYRLMLKHNGWCRFLPIARLSVDRFGKELAKIKPLSENPLDQLAGELKKRLPEMFRGYR